MQEFLKKYASEINRRLNKLPWEKLSRLAILLAETVREERRIFVFGNGACASASSHFVCDLNKGLAAEGIPRVKAISLNDNVALMTAWSNDENYEVVFKEQLVNYLEEGDVVIGLSASGNSTNVLKAIEYANGKNAVTVGLVGMGGGKLAGLAQLAILVESDSYEEVEDIFVIITHMLKLALKRELLSPNPDYACLSADRNNPG